LCKILIVQVMVVPRPTEVNDESMTQIYVGEQRRHEAQVDVWSARAKIASLAPNSALASWLASQVNPFRQAGCRT
jgi:uncharacterized protein YcbX